MIIVTQLLRHCWLKYTFFTAVTERGDAIGAVTGRICPRASTELFRLACKSDYSHFAKNKNKVNDPPWVIEEIGRKICNSYIYLDAPAFIYFVFIGLSRL